MWEGWSVESENPDGNESGPRQLTDFLEQSRNFTHLLAEMVETTAEVGLDEQLGRIREQQDECISALASLVESVDWRSKVNAAEKAQLEGSDIKIASEVSVIYRAVFEESAKRAEVLLSLTDDDPRIAQLERDDRKAFKRLVKARYLEDKEQLIIEFYSAMIRDETGAALAIAREAEIRQNIFEIKQKLDQLIDKTNHPPPAGINSQVASKNRRKLYTVIHEIFRTK